jgi:predicted lactoylglutathione lyase
MKAKKIWVNLGVSDLERTSRFYTELGFKPNSSHNSKELTSFLFGEDDLVIHFFIKDRFEGDVNGKAADLRNGNEVVFSLSAESREEVDEWIEQVKKTGGTIFSGPEEFEKGYVFGFSDPDGHKLNVLYWPE